MSFNFKDIIGNIFYTDEKEQFAEKLKSADLQKKVNDVFGTTTEKSKTNIFNPFLKSNGELVNPFLNYQKLLDSPDISKKAKNYITQATGLATSTNRDNVNSDNNLNTTEYKGTNWVADSPDGVFKNNELMGIIKNVSAETGVPTNVLLSVAQQETGGKWYDKVSDGTGYSYGYMMLYDNGVIADLKAKGKSDLAEKAKVDPYTNVLVGAQYLKQFYDRYGSWEKAAAKYNGAGTAAQNYGSKVWSRANSPAYMNASSNSNYANNVGKKVANTDKYNSGGVYGQCVWYVKGRANEKFGKTFGAWGNANQMWYNAPLNTKLSATLENIKPNIIVSYATAPGTDGQKYGHVIYVEDVVGDTVYYTEGGASYHANGTDGVVKTTTKQGLLDGVNNNGSRIGNSVVGFIDVSKI